MRRSMVALAAGIALPFSVSAQVDGPRREGSTTATARRTTPRANRSARDPAAVSADRCPLAAPALSRLALGGLADDMGLGKTIQVLTLPLVQRAEAGSPTKRRHKDFLRNQKRPHFQYTLLRSLYFKVCTCMRAGGSVLSRAALSGAWVLYPVASPLLPITFRVGSAGALEDYVSGPDPFTTGNALKERRDPGHDQPVGACFPALAQPILEPSSASGAAKRNTESGHWLFPHHG